MKRKYICNTGRVEQGRWSSEGGKPSRKSRDRVIEDRERERENHT